MASPTTNAVIKKARKFAITFAEQGRTKQSMADECDINIMMRKYQKSGIEPAINRYAATFGDFTGVTDFQTAQIQIQEAEEAFYSLGSKVRTRFDNDPAKLLAFMEDPANDAESIELGLTEAPPKPEPIPAPTPEPAVPETSSTT